MKQTTCGIIINIENKILLCHSTGNKHWDIPKGIKENNESEIEAAIRECKEETSLIVEEKDLLYIGKYKYNKQKNIVLFKLKLNKINLEQLNCTSMVEMKNRKPFPEVDDFKLYEEKEAFEKMSNILRTTLQRENIKIV